MWIKVQLKRRATNMFSPSLASREQQRFLLWFPIRKRDTQKWIGAKELTWLDNNKWQDENEVIIQQSVTTVSVILYLWQLFFTIPTGCLSCNNRNQSTEYIIMYNYMWKIFLMHWPYYFQVYFHINIEPLDESERGEWKRWLKIQHSKN